jgi:hypothetical protein
MDARGPTRLLEEPVSTAPTPAKLFNTDDAAVGLHPGEGKERKPIDKRSWDYILRSGFAGGLAGCAVCFPRVLCWIA